MAPTPELIKLILLGVIPPFVITAFIYFFLAPKTLPAPDPVTGKLPAPRFAWILPILLCILFFAIQPKLAGKFVLYPQSASEWPLLICLIATCLSLFALALRRPGALRLALRFALILTLGGFVAQTFLKRWSGIEIAAWLGILSTFTTIAWFSLSHVVVLNKGISGVGVLTLFTLAGAVTCVPGLSSLPSAQFIGIISWSLLGICVVALIRPNLRLAENATHVPLLLTSLITFAVMLGAGDDPVWLKILFASMMMLVPTLPFLVDAIWKPASPTIGRTILRLSLAALPLLVIVAVGGKRAMDAMAADQYTY
ncbi:MAG: hypothetical protein JNM86_01370 [Phycisphaerae bacterium]|nr:hypothetical protein [Phycisphaerae bacterium]